MALAAGDYESTVSEGLGHSGGTESDVTERLTRGHWAGVSTVVGETLHYAVQLDISDLTTDTDTDQGLYSGVFRWVTERPEYDGATVIPTGDNEGNVWKEGIIIGREQLSPIDRIINVNRSGDYGSLSGANFAIDNSSDYGAAVVGFDDYLLTNDYEIINRQIKIYAVIDDVFYQIWGGIVSKTKYNEKVFEFICKDNFEEIHKPMPPNEIVLQKYPDADGDSVGKRIPIVFGDMLRTELINISGKSEPVNIGFNVSDLLAISITAATEYGIESNKPYLIIKTPLTSFGEDDFINNGVFYITVFVGDSQGVLITGNDASTSEDTTSSTTKIFLGSKLTETVDDFNDYNSWQSPILKDATWFFSIYRFNAVYLISDQTLSAFVQDSLNSLDLRRWNDDREVYDPIPELLDSFDNTESNIYEAPNMSLVNPDIDIEGEFNRLIPIFPKSIKYVSSQWEHYPPSSKPAYTNPFETTEPEILLDKDRDSYINFNPSVDFEFLTMTYDIDFPDGFIFEDMTELFMPFSIWIGTIGVPTGAPYFEWNYEIHDQFGQSVYSADINRYPDDPFDSSVFINGLPDDYYKQGNANGETSSFEDEIEGTFLSDLFLLPNISNFKEALAHGKIRITFTIFSPGNVNDFVSVRLREIGFYGLQTINTIKDKMFIKTKGEETGGVETNNVYTAIKHIMEDYDGISSSSIEYDNLGSGTRDTWRVGRQVQNKKLSSVYLKELAAQSFVGIFPDRYGKRHTKSFLDDTSNQWTHADDNGTIIKGSISRFEKTPINELYNDFKIDYDWSPGLERFNQSIYITKTDGSEGTTFPTEYESSGTDTDYTAPAELTNIIIDTGLAKGAATMVASPTWAVVGNKASFEDGSNNNFYYATITGIVSNKVRFQLATVGEIATGVYTTGTLTHHSTAFRKWTQFVGGISSYQTAKDYWEICYNSWLKTKTINKLPAELGECKWFIDGSAFDGTGTGDDNSAAHKFLANLISWSTRQKYRAVYSIPITKLNAEIDLLDVIKFKDQKYTNGDFYTGYIEKIKVNPRTDTIDLESILIPADLETNPPGIDLIIETGSAPDTYTESGSWPNSITEIGV